MTKPVREYILNHLGIEIDHIWRNEKTKFIDGDGTSLAIKRCCSHYNKAMRKISKIGSSNCNTALWTYPFPTASASSSPSSHFRRIDLVGTKVMHADLKVTYFPVEGMDGTGWVITFPEQVRCEYATGCSNHYVCTNTLIVTQLEPYCLRLIDSPPVLLALKVFNLATSSSNLASISWITLDCFIVPLYSQQTIDKM